MIPYGYQTFQIAELRGSRTIAGIDDNGATYHIARLTGHAYYKSYMRRDLWQDTIDDPGQLESRIPHEQAQYILQEARPGTISQLRPILKQVESRITKEMGHKRFNVVVGVPLYLSDQRRRELRSAVSALDLGITVLATARQGLLGTRVFDFHSGSAWGREHTVLIVEYNHASLDVALVTTERGVIDVLKQTSWPFLGEDFLMLKFASLSIEHSITRSHHRALHDRALLIREQRKDLSEIQVMSVNESSIVESAHFEAITHKLTSMIAEQTNAGGAIQNSGPWKPHLEDLSHILISGDASDQGFTSLRKALASNTYLAKLVDPGREVSAPTAAWINAEGAVKDVRGRQFEEEDGSPNWILHHEL